MKPLDENNPYAKCLVSLVVSISNQIPMEKENTVLILMQLNTEKKIMTFSKWIESRMSGETLNATETEIMRASTRISKGLEP